MEPCLIHADGGLREIAQITDFDSFAASVSILPDGECDWELTMPEGVWKRCPIEPGHFVYIEGSGWGGPAEQMRHISQDAQIKLKGTCWRGLLQRRIIIPEPGQTHRILEPAEGNAAVAELLGAWRSGLFSVSGEDSGLVCSASIRYKKLLDVLESMLEAAGGRLDVVFAGGHVCLAAKRARDMSSMMELSQEYDARLLTDSSVRVYNHIIALGRGEMLERQVVELWLTPDGRLTSDPSEVQNLQETSTLLYDYSAVETPDELEAAARNRLLSYAGGSSMEIEMTDRVDLELADTVSVRDTLTGMTDVLKVTAQELTINSSGIILTHHLGK